MKKLSRKNRIIFIITFFLFIAGLLSVASYNLFPLTFPIQQIGLKTPLAVTAAPIASLHKPIKIVFAGSVENANTVPVKTEFSGTLSEIYVIQGQAVQSGQPLFTVEVSAKPFTASEGEISQTTEASQQAKANYENALKEFNRYQKLYEIGGIPRRQLETAAARLQEAQRNLSNDPYLSAGSGNTEPFVGPVTVKAPIDGIVTGLSVTPGKTVQAEQQLLSLGSGHEMEVVLPIDQQDLYLVHLGKQATIELSSQTIAGQVSAIYPEIKDNQVSVFRAHIKLGNSTPGLLELGMPVAVRIDTDQSALVFAIPTVSIFQDNQNRSFVYIAMEGKAVLQQITPGETIGELTEITSNLPKEGMVITSNIQEIRNGVSITVIK